MSLSPPVVSSENGVASLAVPSASFTVLTASVTTAPVPGRRELLIKTEDVTPFTSEALRLPSSGGVILTDVMQGGAASRAGLRVGDTILLFNGSQIPNTETFVRELDRVAPRAQVTATVWRDGRLVPAVVRF